MAPKFELLPAATTLLFFLFTISPLSSATDKVVDLNGEQLRASEHYYFLPMKRGFCGGISLSALNATFSCDLYVSQAERELSRGLPAKFYPFNPKQELITASSDLNIDLRAFTICVHSTATWRLTPDQATGKLYVSTQDVIGDPQAVTDWFKIVKVEDIGIDNVYKLFNCPSVPEIGTIGRDDIVCGDIGVFIEEDETRFLGIRNDYPLLLTFLKA